MSAAETRNANATQARKISGLLDAAETLIDTGADSREIHRLLLAALRELAGQVAGAPFPSARAAGPTGEMLPAVQNATEEKLQPPKNPFEAMIEAQMQRQGDGKVAKASSPLEELSEAIRDGYSSLNIGMLNRAFEHWQRAWQLVKSLAGSTRTTAEFDKAHPGLPELMFNWAQDFEMELSGAAQQDPKYNEERLAYTREFITQFPDEDEATQITFVSGEAEALWELDRREEAELVYKGLIARFPKSIWPHIAWADQYWLSTSASKAEAKEFEKAEALMRQALSLAVTGDDRRAVLERLQSLYKDWGKSEERATVGAELAAIGPEGKP